MDQPALLEMKNISKEFPGVKALDSVSITVRPGTVHALMGENGAGKSTLMKCLFGIYNKDSGTVILDGKEVNFKSSKDALENGVAMSFGGIEQICKDVELPSSGYLYLISGDGEIIYHPRQQLIYAGLQQENNLVAAGYKDGSHTEQFGGERRQVTVKTVGYTGWKIVGVVPADNIWNNYGQLLLFFLFVVLFSIFLLIFVNLHLSERISVPIKELDRAVKELEKGRKQVEFEVSGPYEIEHLSHSIRSMVSTMKKTKRKKKSLLPVMLIQKW